MNELYRKLQDEATLRKSAMSGELADMTALAALYHGELPDEYQMYFPKGTPKHVVNYIRLAWDDLAQSIARQPDVQVDAMNSSSLALRKSQKLEHIVRGYYQNARPSDGIFLFQNAWNLVGLGRFVAVVVPDTKSNAPRLEPRDPRFALPGAKRRIGHIIDELEDIIFEHKVKRTEAVRQGLAAGRDADGTLLTSDVDIYEYIDDKRWAMVGPDGVKSSEHGLGMVPVVYAQTFAPNSGGISQFSEQISLMVAVSRIITQKIAYLDRMVYPVTWVKGAEGEIAIGPGVINKLSLEGEIGQLTPPAQLQVDRDLANLERYQRILNRNPEVRQGEVDGKGAYVGSKTLETLNDSVDNSVARFWDVMQSAYQKLAACAMAMDEVMFDGEKTISLVADGQREVVTYVPSEDIGGRREVRIAYGFGRGGGYQAFLETVQGFQAELLPKRRAVEAMPGGQDANRILRELELDKIDEVAFAGFLAAAQNNQLDMALWAKYRKEMENKGIAWHEAFAKYEEAFKKQAAEAAEQPIPETALTTAPPAPPGAEAMSEPLPGAPSPALLGV